TAFSFVCLTVDDGDTLGANSAGKMNKWQEANLSEMSGQHVPCLMAMEIHLRTADKIRPLVVSCVTSDLSREYAKAVGCCATSAAEATEVSHYQRKYLSSAATYHFGSGVHLRMLEKSSSYDLSDAQINDGIGSHGRNKQLTNRVAASESSISIPSYGIISDKALKPESQTTKQSLQLKLCKNAKELDKMENSKAKAEKNQAIGHSGNENACSFWVACDKCKRWQHQICALFNAKRNEEEEAEFTCHDCYIQEIKHGLRVPLLQNNVLGAKDLPRTLLSNHLEERIFQRLKEERQARAEKIGKKINEVPGAEGLVVRVVSSVDKKLEVKPQFLEIFQEENYPTEFPYKSKAILLFQRIEGVEVCIFAMYVQEFGTECAFPNQRRVYLSYLDSVKYFRPEIETVSGEALRTFVYHEILIGYLQYCKQRGFTSCYIWACPPLKGEDYIMYCHPEIQKTPKSDKLREWYLSMLQKAIKEGIVVELTNLYDHFFVPKRECKAKVTAARLPYFDGDYWPGAAEDMINQIRLSEGDRNLQKKGKMKNTITKRDLKAAGITELSGNASKDAMLMQKLDKCYNIEQQCEEKDKHPSNSRDIHTLHEVEIIGVPEDTKDRDNIIESEFFDTRQAFLSLCQGNHYQYDTLRNAKHSSMMVLHHLHNPTEPAFVTTCNACENDIKTGQVWRCKECDYDECTACYQKHGGANHAHTLTKHPAGADKDIQTRRQKFVEMARIMQESLAHAVKCRASPRCQYPFCRKLKLLFLHGSKCQERASGGCPLCKKVWGIIHFHVRICKESQCKVPRCRDLKEFTRRLQRQSESRRRAAVNEMMRQRAAESGVNQ
ncbi:hypothetical protein EJB05_41055, partial [Eragrostis curvula]